MVNETKNSNLSQAKIAKNDEFYTRMEDVAKEIANYGTQFSGKVVYCNCDDYRVSNFVKYFKDNFGALGLKLLISTGYSEGGHGIGMVFDGSDTKTMELRENGDFRSPECVAFLEQADIVVTNPPFSLFREFVSQLLSHNKKFLIVGNNNAITYKEIFHYIRDNKMWVGVSPRSMEFNLPDGTTSQVNANWYTNLPHGKRNKHIELTKRYKDCDYKKYDNYDAIEVSKTSDIPMDYDGEMGVPITFLDKYNPEQFEIVGSLNNSNFDTKEDDGYVISRNTPTMIGGVEKSWNGPVIGKQPLYKRIVVRHKDQLGVKLLKLLNEVHDIVSAGGSIDNLLYNQISVLYIAKGLACPSKGQLENIAAGYTGTESFGRFLLNQNNR